ncbi:MAG: MFS transporter [Spirochaetota bacterium]|nr:MFS transporter [Spirochaetota bacterium]
MRKSDSPKIFYGWFVVLGGFLAMLSGGILFSYGVFFDAIRIEFGWSYTTTSSIHSITLVMALIFTLMWGPLIDRYGSTPALIVAAIAIGLGLYLSSLSQNLWQFYLYRAIGCIGASTMTVSLSVVQKWFVERRGLVVSIVIAGVGVGQFTFPILSEVLITGYGWRTALACLGIINTIIIMISAYLIVDEPQKKGLSPYGGKQEEISESGRSTNETREQGQEPALREILKSTVFIAIIVYNILTVIPVHIVYVHLVPYVIKSDIAPLAKAGIVLSVIGGLSIVGRLVFGAITPNISGWRMGLVICSVLCGIAMLWLSVSHSFWMVFVFAIIYGIFQGGRTPLVPGVIGTYFGNSNLASLIAISSASMILGAAIGPVVAGYICDVTGSYYLAFIVGAISYFLGASTVIKIHQP